MRVVIDTNIFISGIFWKGNSNKIINAWRDRKIDLVTSLENIRELVKFLKDFKIGMEEELIQGWVNLIIENSILVNIENKISIIKDNPSDNKFIETAVNGNADYIITQDKHLLNIEKFEDIRILPPEVFLKILSMTIL